MTTYIVGRTAAVAVALAVIAIPPAAAEYAANPPAKGPAVAVTVIAVAAVPTAVATEPTVNYHTLKGDGFKEKDAKQSTTYFWPFRDSLQLPPTEKYF